MEQRNAKRGRFCFSHGEKHSLDWCFFSSRQVWFLRQNLTRKSELQAAVLPKTFFFFFKVFNSLLPSRVPRTFEGNEFENSSNPVSKGGPLILDGFVLFCFYLCPLEGVLWVPADGSCFDVF